MRGKSWRVWCPECGRPFGRHQWGRNRGKPVVCQHARAGAAMPRGLSPSQRGAWRCAHACPGSLAWGRPVTSDEEAALALAAPTAAVMRALAVIGEGKVDLDVFARALYPNAAWGIPTREGRRGVMREGKARELAARRLSALVLSGLVDEEWDAGSARSLWRLRPPALAALAAAEADDAPGGRAPGVRPARAVV